MNSCILIYMRKCLYNYLELVHWKLSLNSWSNMIYVAGFIYIDLVIYLFILIFYVNNVVVLLLCDSKNYSNVGVREYYV